MVQQIAAATKKRLEGSAAVKRILALTSQRASAARPVNVSHVTTCSSLCRRTAGTRHASTHSTTSSSLCMLCCFALRSPSSSSSV